MKILKIIGLVLLVLIAVLVVVVYTQPSEGHLEKSIVIMAPASRVFREVNSFEHFNDWSPWAKMDPSSQYTFEGPASGVGAKMSWDGEKVGKGSQWIEESVENEKVKNGMSFGEYEGAYFATFTLAKEDDGTLVTWSYDGPNPGFMSKMMWLFMKGMMDEQFEQGLNDLKTMIESSPASSIEISEESVESVHYISLSHTMSPQNDAAIANQMGSMYGKLMAAMQKAKVEMAGPPFCLYPSYSEESMEMVCAIPVAAAAKVPGYEVTEGYQGAVVKGIHKGDYHLLEKTHQEISSYITDHELQISGAPWETYITDPSQVQDTSMWITEVYYPVSN